MRIFLVVCPPSVTGPPQQPRRRSSLRACSPRRWLQVGFPSSGIRLARCPQGGGGATRPQRPHAQEPNRGLDKRTARACPPIPSGSAGFSGFLIVIWPHRASQLARRCAGGRLKPGAGTEAEAGGSPPGGGTSWDQVDRYAAEALLHDVCDALAVEVFKRRLLGLSALSFVGRSHAADAAGSAADRRTRFAEAGAARAQPAAESNAADAAAAASLAAGAAEARARRSFSASPRRCLASGPLPNGGPYGVV